MSDAATSDAATSDAATSDAATPTSAQNGEGAAPSAENQDGGAATASPPEVTTSAALKLNAQHKVQQAIALAKTHPLGAVATVAAAAALVEVEFAVGILAGLGATALLVGQTGPEARQKVLARGKKAIARARIAIAKRNGLGAATPSTVPPTAPTPVGAPQPPAA